MTDNLMLGSVSFHFPNYMQGELGLAHGSTHFALQLDGINAWGGKGGGEGEILGQHGEFQIHHLTNRQSV